MPNEINRILKLFADLQHGDCWIGLNFKEVLHGVDAVKASESDRGRGQQYLMLVSHLIYWHHRGKPFYRQR